MYTAFPVGTGTCPTGSVLHELSCTPYCKSEGKAQCAFSHTEQIDNYVQIDEEVYDFQIDEDQYNKE